MSYAPRALVIVALAAACVTAAASADEHDAQVEFRYGIWRSDRSLTDAENVNIAAVAATARSSLSAASQLRFDAISMAEHPSGGATSDRTAVREAMLTHEIDGGELRLGWQTFAWGRADRINPTDVLTPRNYRLLVPLDEEQRVGAPAASANLDLSQTLRVISVVQHFVPSRMPSDDAEAGLARVARGPDTEWAVKLDRTGAGVDWSASYFRGREKNRVLALPGCSAADISAVREHPAIRMLGADAAATRGRYGLRGEIARVEVADGEPSACGGRSGYIAAVAGIDRNLAGDASIGVQWFARRYDDDLAAPAGLSAARQVQLAQFQAVNGQIARVQQGVTLRYAQRFLNDRFDWEWLAVYQLRTHDYVLRPRLTYRLDDRVRLVAGADEFRGAADTPLGLLRKNSGAFIELHVDIF